MAVTNDPKDDGALASAMERFKQGTEEPEKEEETSEEAEGSVVVDTEAEEDEGDEEPPERPTRAEKKRNRYRQAQEEAREARERAEQAAQEAAALKAEMARVQGYLVARHQQQAPQGDPEMAQLRAAYQNTYSEEHEFAETLEVLRARDPAEFQRRMGEFQAKLGDIHLRRARYANAVVERERAPYQQQAYQQQQQQRLMEHLAIQNPDVWADQRRVLWARTRHSQLVLEGHPDSMETVNRALEDTRRHFGLKGGKEAPRPTKAQQQKYMGAPVGARGAAPTSGGPVVMNRDMQTMARARYPQLDPADAYKAWAKEVYPSYKAAQERRGR